MRVSETALYEELKDDPIAKELMDEGISPSKVHAWKEKFDRNPPSSAQMFETIITEVEGLNDGNPRLASNHQTISSG